MFTGMIAPTPFDLRWRMFGTDIRVNPLFWVGALYISWPLNRFGFQWMLLGVVCVFVSILLHEFGHVFASRSFGVDSHIVLWAMGGLAIPDRREAKRWQRIIVFAAGPAIQLVFWAILLFCERFLPVPEVPDKTIFGIHLVYGFLMLINVYWALLNLLPIWPLDGGQISREVFSHFSRDNGVRLSLHLSMGVALLLAIHAIIGEQRGPLVPYLPVGTGSAIFFGLFFFIGLQSLQYENVRDRWRDDPWN
jgi:Zn-dependent protease